jgi:hypothetical protein
LGLLAAWMLGGLEGTFGKAELGALLDMTDVQNLLQMLENNKENFVTEKGVFRCGRHPAWCLLVMRAVDAAQGLETLSVSLRSRLLQSSKRPDLKVKTLTSYLFAMLYHRIMPPDELGFMCSGPHMHEEFADATTLAYELSDAKEDADLNGHLLNEVAYWHSLHGDLDRARQYFRWSRLKEFKDPRRRARGLSKALG